MTFELKFTAVKSDQIEQIVTLQQKIAAIEELIVQISNDRANMEAQWRKKENYLNTEKGKLEIELRSITTGTLTEIV